MKFGQVFYAVVAPNGDFISGYNSKTNGLFSSKGRAQAIKTKELTRMEGWLKNLLKDMEDFPERRTDTRYTTALGNYERNLQAIRDYRIVPVEVVEVRQS